MAAPWCFLVTNLPQLALDTLLEKQCWSSPSITFFAIPFSPPAFSYVCTIENLTFDELEARDVLQLVKTTIQGSERVATHIAEDNPDPGALHATVQSTRIAPLRLGLPRKLGGGHKLVWNMYINPPSQTPTRQRDWRKTISSLTFLTAISQH
jgi:hypothetical protein